MQKNHFSLFGLYKAHISFFNILKNKITNTTPIANPMKTLIFILAISYYVLAQDQPPPENQPPEILPPELQPPGTQPPETLPPVVGGWVPVDWATVGRNDPSANDALNFGVNWVVTEGVNEGILNQEFEVEVLEVNSLETQLVAGMNYDFDVSVFGNGQSADLDFVVYDQLDGEQLVTAWEISNVEGQ